MFGLGMGEIMVILIVALLVLGPSKLPEAAKQIGKAIRELRKHTDSLRDTIETDEQLSGTVRELRSALRGDIMNTVMPPARPAAPEEPRPDAPHDPHAAAAPVDPVPVAAPVPDPVAVAVPVADPVAVPVPVPVPVPDPVAGPVPGPVPDPVAGPVPGPVAVPVPAPVPAAVPVPPRPEGAVAQGESDPEGGRSHG